MTAESGFLTDPMIQTPDERLPPKRSKCFKKGLVLTKEYFYTNKGVKLKKTSLKKRLND